MCNYLEYELHFVHADSHKLGIDVKHAGPLGRANLEQHVLEPVTRKREHPLTVPMMTY